MYKIKRIFKLNLVMNEELINYSERHHDPIIRSVHQIVLQYLDLDEKIPDSYRWLFSSKESLDKQLKAVTDIDHKKMNYIYWNDQTSNIEAYCHMTFWRGAELIKSCINGLNSKETIVPAIAARSLLELSTVFLINTNVLSKTFSQITFPIETVVTSTEVENLIIKMIWGTRYDNPEPYLEQTNIMTSLKKLAKISRSKQFMPTYEFLCDIAHPSFIGNTSYWSHLESVTRDGRENRVISRLNSRDFKTDILDKTMWSLSWSAECIKNSFEILMQDNRTLLKKLNNSQ